MSWRPSSDPTLQRVSHSSFWEAIEPIFDKAISLEPIARGDDKGMKSYVRQRKGDSLRDNIALRSRLPKQFDEVDLGSTDIELIDFVLNYTTDRVLILEGPRGAGKTSLLHFVENVLTSRQGFPTFVFVILNGLLLADGKVNFEDFASLLLEELKQKRETSDDKFATAFDRAIEQLEKSREVEGVRNAVKCLAQYMPEGDLRRIVFVFDNLDQLSGAAVTCALDLAQVMYVTSKIGVIVTLRPGSLAGAIERGSALAFFQCKLKVSQPSVDALLLNLQNRIISAAEQSLKENGRLPIAHNQEITPQQIGSAIDRFTRLLYKQYIRPKRDVVRLLEAVSANDTRLLIRLIRRILSHRELPDRYLLGLDEERPFYSFVSMMVEGEKYFFTNENRSPVPNLLYFDAGEEGAELLLSYRILQLLTSRKYTPSPKLFNWLTVGFKYAKSSCVRCLSMLQQVGLVGASDMEIVDDGNRQPAAWFLTEAGYYYLRYLLRHSEYLTSVVVDVPLLHQRFSETPTWGKADTFAARLDSFVEYIEEVRQREEKIVERLRQEENLTPMHRRAVNVLSKGGLFTASLLDALKDVVGRSPRSISTQVKEAGKELEPKILEFGEWIANMEARLAETANRGRRAEGSSSKTITKTEQGVEVQVTLSDAGDSKQLSVEIVSEEDFPAALVAIEGGTLTAPLEKATTATLVKEVGFDGNTNRLKGDFHEIPEESISSLEDMSVQVIPLAETPKGFALLSVDEIDGKLQVKLNVVRGRDCVEFDLGREVSGDAITREMEAQLKEVGGHVTGGLPFGDILRAIGTRLAIQILSREGQYQLASQYYLVDRVVIHSRFSSIPWEWLCPPPVGGNELPILSEVWRSVRWPANLSSIKAIILALANQEEKMESLCTIGLGSDKPWRKKAPSSMRDLQTFSSQFGTLHLVGHHDEKGLHLQDGFAITPDLARAFSLPRKVRTIILSACEAAVQKEIENLTVALSSTSECVAWAPLVRILEDDARKVDEALAEYRTAFPKGTFDDFLKKYRSQISILSLYVRYGLHG